MVTARFLRTSALLALVAVLLAGWAGPGYAQVIPPSNTVAAQAPGVVRLVSAASDRLVLELDTQQFSLEPGTVSDVESEPASACQTLSVAGYASTSRAGAPQLPVKGALLGIPSGAQVELVILEVEAKPLPGVYHLCPAARPQVRGLNPAEQSVQPGLPQFAGYQALQDPQAYAQPGFMPQQPAELGITGFVRSQRVAQVLFQPFQYNPVTGELRQVSHIRVALQLAGASMVAHPLQAGEGFFETVLRDSLLNYSQARAWRVLPVSPGIQKTIDETAAPLTIKILVDQDGIYQITYADLAGLGIDVNSILPSTFRLFNQGVECAIYVAGEASSTFNPDDYILFYGQAVDTKYTGSNVYYLQVGPGFGKRMAEKNAPPNGAQEQTYFMAEQHFETNLLYLTASPSGPDQDAWYWDYVYAVGAPDSITLPVTLTYPLEATAPVSATLRGLLGSYAATPQHHTRIYVNGHLVDDATWSATEDHAFQVDFPQSYLVPRMNQITLECPLDNNISVDVPLVNYYELKYAAGYVAQQDQIGFSPAVVGSAQFSLSNFSSPDLELYEFTSPQDVVILNGFQVAQDAELDQKAQASYSLVFGRNFLTGTEHYFAQAVSLRLSPKQILLDTPSDLHDTGNGADYIIISHPDFIASLQPLADYRAGQGLRVKMVDIFDVYDEFSYGLVDPQAIRDFLAYAYASWTPPAPLYVLEVGDGTYDPRNYLGLGDPTYIPPYLVPEVDPYMGETVADNRLAMVAGDDSLADMALGRIPARTSAQVDLVVNKILTYESAPYDPDWIHKVLFIADNRDSGGIFDNLSDRAVQVIPSYYAAVKVYFGINYTNPTLARQAIRDAINNGVLLVNYVGHGAVNFWGGEYYLDSTGVSLLTNADRLAFFVPMTCQEGSYQHPTYTAGESQSLAEDYLFHPGGGAVGSWSPTGLGIATGHDYLNRGLYTAFFQKNVHQVGLAVLQADIFLASGGGANHLDLLSTYLIFGDPALRLHIPEWPVFLPVISLLP
jgi:hypothetical protein